MVSVFSAQKYSGTIHTAGFSFQPFKAFACWCCCVYLVLWGLPMTVAVTRMPPFSPGNVALCGVYLVRLFSCWRSPGSVLPVMTILLSALMSASVWGPVFTLPDICLGVEFMSHGFLCLTCWRSKFYFKCKSKYIKCILLVDIRNMFFIVRQDRVQIAAPLLSSCDLGQVISFLAHFFSWSLWAVNSPLQVVKESGDTGRPFIRT